MATQLDIQEVEGCIFYRDVELACGEQPYTRATIAGTYRGRQLVGYLIEVEGLCIVRGPCPVNMQTGQLADLTPPLVAVWIQAHKEKTNGQT